MIKISLNLTESQIQQLKTYQAGTGLTVAVMIRKAIDKFLVNPEFVFKEAENDTIKMDLDATRSSFKRKR